MTAVEHVGLFPEPEHTPPRTDGPWLIAAPPGCWRYMFLGEDGEWLLIEGHLREPEALAVLDHAGFADFEDVGRVLVHTWACELSACPDHGGQVLRPGDCEYCAAFKALEGPWWDWSTPPGEPSDANRNKPGYFPATVVDLEA